jgi:hypothetical protein
MESSTEGVPVEVNLLGRSTIEVVRDYTQVQDENSPIILVNPAHGNEPYILGTAIAKGVGKRLAEQGLGQAKIVVPLMYGERQKRILMEENPDDAGLIYYDEAFGGILRDITFQNGDYSDHLRQIQMHYDEVEAMLKQRFGINANSFDARTLSTNESVSFSPKNIVATIDTAARVTVEAPQRYFAFPLLLSELLRETQKAGLGFSEADMQAVINRMLKVESAYSQVFIPKINPLSFQYADDLSAQPTTIDGRSRVYTPAMKKDYVKTSGKVEEPGIYVMFSGTGSNIEASKALVKAATEAGLRVYTPPWVEVKGSTSVSPDVLSDENIVAVMGRGGWGTGWQVQNLALPWLVTPYEVGDDPEIYFNNKTIEAMKMGKVLTDAGMTFGKLTAIINNLSVGTQALNKRIQDEFGTLNGIDFIADAIAADFLAKR